MYAARNPRARQSNRCSRYSGIVVIRPSRYFGRNQRATITSVIAAIHSYEAMASPKSTPAPAIPTKCSVEMLLAIRLIPISHQGRFLPARK